MQMLRLTTATFGSFKFLLCALLMCTLFMSCIAFSHLARSSHLTHTPLAAIRLNDHSVLRIGIEGAQPPFNMIDRKGSFKGFEPDFTLELCRRLQATCIFERFEWDSLVPALEARKIDAIVSSLSISDEMMEKITFSVPYYRIPSAFMAEKKDLPLEVSPEALKNKHIGTLAKDKLRDYLKDKYPQSHVTSYDTIEEAYLDALSDRITVFFADRLSLQLFSNTPLGKLCAIVGSDHTDPAYFGQGVGVGLRQSDDALKKRIDLVITQMRQDGALERMSKPYFSFSLQ